MPPRLPFNRKHSSSSTAGKLPGKKSTKANAPELTLQEILKTLNITFNNELGILNGEATNVIPPVATVENLRKLLLKLNDQLEIVSNSDDAVILQVQRILTAREKGELLDSEASDEDEESTKVSDQRGSAVDADGDVNVDSDDGTANEEPIVITDDSTTTEVKREEDDADKLLPLQKHNGGDTNSTEIPPNADIERKKNSNNDDNDGNGEDEDQNEDEENDDEEDEDEGEDDEEDEDEDDDKDVFTDATDHIKIPEPKERKMSTDRIENDPTVRNPKSEFVTSQTLPAAAHALGLFSEEDGGLNQTGEEYLKKKYAVASYPKTNLQDKLPGVIPDIDFSKSKPSNQVQFATFQSWFENFYRQFTEDDLKFLKSKHNMPESLSNDSTYDPNLTPYLIPDLGPLYSDVWNEEENAGNYSPPPQRVTKDAVIPKKSATDLNDDNLETENVSCGPLVSRLLSAILRDEKDDVNTINGENGVAITNGATTNGTGTGTGGTGSSAGNDDDEDGRSRTSATAFSEQQGWKVSSVNADYSTLEDRLKRELKYIGIFMNLSGDKKKQKNNNKKDDDDGDDDDDEAEPDWLNPQDDEVSSELRLLQNELKQSSKRNGKRKKILLPVIENQLAWQEYNSILDDLEKQVDQSYLKRIRAPKNKKRKTGGSSSSLPPSVQVQLNAHAAQQAAANSAVKSLLDKRQKWIEKIGPLFDRDGNGPESSKKYPKESVFDKENLEEDEDDDYEDGDDLVLQQQDHH